MKLKKNWPDTPLYLPMLLAKNFLVSEYAGEVTNLESMDSVHCAILHEHGMEMRAS